MPEQIFISLSVIIGAVLLSLGVMKLLRQPMIIGYIIAGTLISVFLPGVLHQSEAFQSFANIGISFLLFMVGIELNPKIIKEMGKSAVVAGLAQVLITGIIGRASVMWLGYDILTSLYIGAGVAFSSTIVVLKLLSDKEETESTAGRLSVGVLIIQDMLVMLVFLAIATYSNLHTGSAAVVIGSLVIKMLAIGSGLYLVSKYIIPKIMNTIAESQEFLFLFAIGRCLIVGTIFHYAGLSIEFGTLIAGISLSSSPFRYEISSKIKSLRDFFIVMFFVLLGSQINFHGIQSLLLPILLLSIAIIVIKPIITMIIFSIMGHTKKNSFLSGISIGQLSEFSFLLIGMGIGAGHIKDTSVVSLVTIVGLISITLSSYLILYGEVIYQKIYPLLKYLPGKRSQKEQEKEGISHEIILFGYGRFGSNLYESLIQRYQDILVVDEHPAIINHLKKKSITSRYGDGGDIGFLEELDLHHTKMIISTIKTFQEDMVLISTIKHKYPHIIIITVSNHVQESIKLYEAGADYVILPHYIGVSHTSLMLEEYGFDINKFLNEKTSQVHELKNRHKDLMIEALLAKVN